MDYLVQYEDGSSGYLQHYGVKGMKWGMWNPETRARYTGTGEHNRYDKNVEKAHKRYNKAEIWFHNNGAKGPLRKELGKIRRDKALNKYADAVIKGYKKTGTASERERRRNIEELAADKHMGEAYRIGNAEHLSKERDSYYKTISAIEMGRAVDKAIPKGREAVKAALRWGHETSAKTNAAIGGTPVKTEKEARKYHSLNDRFERTWSEYYNNGSADAKKKFDRAQSDFEKFEEQQRKKYFDVY